MENRLTEKKGNCYHYGAGGHVYIGMDDGIRASGEDYPLWPTTLYAYYIYDVSYHSFSSFTTLLCGFHWSSWLKPLYYFQPNRFVMYAKFVLMKNNFSKNIKGMTLGGV